MYVYMYMHICTLYVGFNTQRLDIFSMSNTSHFYVKIMKEYVYIRFQQCKMLYVITAVCANFIVLF